MQNKRGYFEKCCRVYVMRVNESNIVWIQMFFFQSITKTS